MKFMGHQLEGVHGIYGNPWVLPHESEMIKLVAFKEVDFGLYLANKLVGRGALWKLNDARYFPCRPSSSVGSQADNRRP